MLELCSIAWQCELSTIALTDSNSEGGKLEFKKWQT